MEPNYVLALRTEQTTRLMNGGRLPPIGERFQDVYCRLYTDLLDRKAIFYRQMEADESSNDPLLDPEVFLPGAFSAGQNWALYWAIEQSVAEISALCANRGLNEEFQTSAFFGALRANLTVYAALDPRLESEGAFSFYFADCKSESTESALGADFALIYPLGNDRFKVALFQAKIVGHNRLANVYRYNSRNDTYQLDQLAATNRQLQLLNPPRKIRGQCCYYAFWHKSGDDAMLRPTLRTVGQVELDVSAKKRLHNWVQGENATVWSVSPFRRATFFSEFASLLLPAKDSYAGSCLNRDELIDLLKRPHTRPKNVLGIASARTGFTLRHWLEMDLEIEPASQEFSSGGQIYNRDQRTPEDPWSSYDPLSK